MYIFKHTMSIFTRYFLLGQSLSLVAKSAQYTDPMLDHRLRRRPNLEPALGQCIVFAQWLRTWQDVIVCWLS